RDPGAALISLIGRKHAHLAWEDEAQRIHRVPQPADIGDDGHPFPLRKRFQTDPEILPSGTRKATADLIIEPDLLVPLKRGLHQRLQDLVAVLVGDPPLSEDPHDIVREPLDNLDHRSLLVLPPTAPRKAARPPSSRPRGSYALK